jgi:hypothetical protein
MAEVGRQLQRYGHGNTGMLFQNIMEEDPEEMLLDGVTACAYAGAEKVGDKATQHLRFTQPDFSWKMWVAAEGKPFVLKVATTHQVEGGKLIIVETHTDWKLDVTPAAKVFAFSAPSDAKKVKVLGRKPSREG